MREKNLFLSWLNLKKITMHLVLISWVCTENYEVYTTGLCNTNLLFYFAKWVTILYNPYKISCARPVIYI